MKMFSVVDYMYKQKCQKNAEFGPAFIIAV